MRMKATNLREALDILDPRESGLTGTQLAEFFVPRPGSPLDRLAAVLANGTRPQKILGPIDIRQTT
jgi:hypothetical protein